MENPPAVPRSSSTAYVVAPLVLIALILACTRVWTTFRYYQSLRQFKNTRHAGPKIVKPPQIPYSIPWLGNTLSYLAPHPGRYWTELFRWHPRSTGALTLLIGGKKTHFLYSPAAIQALFRAKGPNRDTFERELFHKLFTMPQDQIDNAEEGKHLEIELNAKYLTNFDRVNELTAEFTRVLDDVLRTDAENIVRLEHIGVFEWLRDRMFRASTIALMGDKLLEMYPNWSEDFFGFDADFLEFFFSKPNILMREANERRQRMFRNLAEWSIEMHRLSGGKPVDPDGPVWEPYFGSRLNRARQIDYKNRKLNAHSGGALDVGITFALSSNVIPATFWMLVHVLDPNAPSTWLPKILAEIKTATRPDHSLDIATLTAQPLLQSLWTESLRVCSDVLVVRDLPEDITLPLDEDGKVQVYLHKGHNVFVPSWPSHRNPSWSTESSPHDVFDAERFVVKDPKTGEESFSMSRSAGSFFPFGGGKTICPGRVFAKQEAIGALAMVLLKFEFEVKGFVDGDKRPTKSFPGFMKAFPGTGALTPGGDMLVRISRRT